jgi:hypothetical protein
MMSFIVNSVVSEPVVGWGGWSGKSLSKNKLSKIGNIPSPPPSSLVWSYYEIQYLASKKFVSAFC